MTTPTNTTPDQNKSPVQAPGNEKKTPEQLALDKANEANNVSKSSNNADQQKNNNSTENKA